jgi:hypothetical protein
MSKPTKDSGDSKFARKGSLSKEALDSIKKDLRDTMEKVDRDYANKERQSRIDASKVVLNA